MSQEVRYCRSKDGAQLAYALEGHGSPLVFSATWMTHLQQHCRSPAWQPWWDAFSPNRRTLRYDARGCGLSDRDAGNLSFESWIDDFEAVIDAASLKQFPIVGICQGGPIAIEYAARHPERVTKLILYGTYALGRMAWHDRPKEIETARVVTELIRLGWDRDSYALSQVWANAFQPGATIADLRAWSDQQRAATSAETAIRLFEIGWNVDVREAARNIKCPVLVLHPERDRVMPVEEGRALAGLIPDARFIPVDSENHMPLADEPTWARMVADMRQFLAEPVALPTANQNGLPLDELTERERAVLEGIAEGLDNSELASLLGLSEKTVRNHITRVFDKIRVKHRYEAIVRARDAGLGMNGANRAR